MLRARQRPGLEGLDATSEMRKAHPRGTIPIIAMTANAFAEDKARCFEAGMDDFVSKPIAPDGLYGLVLEWLRERTPGVPRGPGLAARL